jgi:hypothetical protein
MVKRLCDSCRNYDNENDDKATKAITVLSKDFGYETGKYSRYYNVGKPLVKALISY